MNDVLRLLAKFLRRYGYDIKRYYQYNLLPISSIDSFGSIGPLYRGQSESEDHDNNLNQLYICLRTCLRCNTNKSRPPEITGSTHDELVYRCINSLVGSINQAIQKEENTKIKFIVFDDHSDKEQKNTIEDICRNAKSEFEIRTTRETGQGNSLYEQFAFAREQNGLFYFCEDDYLHEVTAITEMLEFYRQVFFNCNTHLVIHPQEHEFLFNRYVYPSYILLGENRRWRTISHATHTLFTHSSLVSKYWQYFENTRYVGDRKKRRLGVESRTTNHLFQHGPGFAPIPALAAHMQTTNCLPPYFDWRPLWNKYQVF